jgi:hypothetical protein
MDESFFVDCGRERERERKWRMLLEEWEGFFRGSGEEVNRRSSRQRGIIP